MWGLSFLNPLVLFGALALPALWWLLRVTPPPPRLQALPTTRFLHDLPRSTSSAVRTPWWILLLRLMALLFLILGIAGPVIAPRGDATVSSAPLHLVIENGWSAVTSWPDQIRSAEQIIRERANTAANITITTTAPDPGNDRPARHGPMTAARALDVLTGLRVMPWGNQLRTIAPIANAETIWLGDGLDHDGLTSVLKRLEENGPTRYIGPARVDGPVRLARDLDAETGVLAVRLEIPQARASDTVYQLSLRGENDRVLISDPVRIRAGATRTTHRFATDTLDGAIPTRVQVAGVPGAAALVLLDGLVVPRNVAIIGNELTDDDVALTRPEFFLTRALAPYARTTITTLERAMDGTPDIIIAPDLTDPDARTREDVIEFVQRGGVLLRFAGRNTVERADIGLLPTPIYQGARALAGLSNWSTPPVLMPFDKDSPLAQLTPPATLNIRQQLLAQALPATSPVIWARFSDGTPFITGRGVGKGHIILVHTSADPSWSDLPLTGFFVSFVKQVVMMAGTKMATTTPADRVNGFAQPVLSIDGTGTILPAAGSAEPFAMTDAALPVPSPRHPPGLYRAGTNTIALNLGEQIAMPNLFRGPPDGVVVATFDARGAMVDLRPYALGFALMLLLIDGMIVLALQGLRFRVAMLLPLLLMIPQSAQAADTAPSLQTHFAYVITGTRSIDAQSRTGLDGLADTVRDRTIVNMGDTIGVDIARDDISLYPFLYWPVNATTPLPDNQTADRVRAYLGRGGMIVFDTMDGSTTDPPVPTASWRQLQLILTRLNIGPVRAIDDGHVLLRAFYLLERYSPSPNFGALWVQQTAGTGNDGVSSVIVSGGNWAKYWAMNGQTGWENGRPDDAEIARRYGVNMTLYALTGNYKADQVHIQYILDRLNGPTRIFGDQP